jgi:parallel beta-helix repeat protein
MGAISRMAFILLLLSSLILVLKTQPSVAWIGTVYIGSDGSIAPAGAPIQRSGSTYTLTDNIYTDADGIVVQCSNIVIDGARYIVQGAGSGRGMYVSNVNNVTVKNLRIKMFDYGIDLEGSSSNSIFGDNITNNYYGLWLFSSSDNSIARNNITANDYFSIQLTVSSNNNIIFHNNFGEDNNQVYVDTSCYGNVWDNGCEGNYWSTYTGEDLDAPPDGVGDTLLPWEEVEMYPLMNLYWNPADINHDLKVDIKDVSFAARAFGSTPGHPKWNPHADITGLFLLVPDGKVDIRDISMIAKSFGKQYS